MTIKINYLDDGVGIEILASGIVSGNEVLEAHKKIYSAENLARQRYQIVDRTRCDYYCLRPEEIKEIAEMDKTAAQSNPNIRIAIVSTTDQQFSMTRMWQIYVQKSPIVTKIFHDRQSADAWIHEQMSKPERPAQVPARNKEAIMTQKTKKVCPTCQGKKVIEGVCTCNMEWRGTQKDDEWEDCQCTPELKCATCAGTGFVDDGG